MLTLASPILLPCAAAAACFTMPHIAYMAVAFVSAIVFCGISFLMTMADFELDPKCKRWLGSPHARSAAGGEWVSGMDGQDVC